jgi:hypothetical protein
MNSNTLTSILRWDRAITDRTVHADGTATLIPRYEWTERRGWGVISPSGKVYRATSKDAVRIAITAALQRSGKAFNNHTLALALDILAAGLGVLDCGDDDVTVPDALLSEVSAAYVAAEAKKAVRQ